MGTLVQFTVSSAASLYCRYGLETWGRREVRIGGSLRVLASSRTAQPFLSFFPPLQPSCCLRRGASSISRHNMTPSR